MAELIDLSKVPVPDIIQPLSFEQRFAALKQILISIDERYQDVLALESDPIAKLLQVFAYREMHLVAQINDATRGNILASSTGNDLIALGSRYDLAPLVIQAGMRLQYHPSLKLWKTRRHLSAAYKWRLMD